MSSFQWQRFRLGIIVLLVVLVVTPVVLWPGIGIVGGSSGLLACLGLAAVVVVLALAVSGSPADGDEEGDDGDAETDTAVWNAIPPWQYGGRHVESGGLTRDEQEQSLREIENQAEAIERLDLTERDP